MYTLDQAKVDTFSKDLVAKRLYDALEDEYKLKSQLIKSRIQSGLSQKELAEILNTKQSAISRYEKEDSMQMSIKQLYKIAHALGKEVEIVLR